MPDFTPAMDIIRLAAVGVSVIVLVVAVNLAVEAIRGND